MDDRYAVDGGQVGSAPEPPKRRNGGSGTTDSDIAKSWGESGKLVESLLQQSSDAIFLIDPVSERILDANEAASDYLGYSREELLDMRSSDLIGDGSLQNRKTRRKRIREGGIHTFHVSHRRKDGTTVPVEIRVVVVEIGGRPIAQTIVRNLDIRDRAVAALRESEFRFRKIFDDSAIGMTIVDNEGRYRAVNQAFCRMIGYAQDEVLGRSVWDVTHPDDRQFAQEDHARVLVAGDLPLYREKRYCHKDGHTVWAALHSSPYRDPGGEILFQMGQVQDITERKVAEDALRESELRFRDFAGSSADRFWETDENHVFTYVSPVPADNNLHSSKEFIGRQRLNFIEINDDPERFERHAADLAARRPFRDFRFRIRDRFGGIAHLRVNGTPFFGPDGTFRGYRGTVVDETGEVEARNQAESARQRFFDALDGVSENAILWDAEGKLVTCNFNFRKNHPEMASIIRAGMTHEEYIRARVATMSIAGIGDDPEDWIQSRLKEFREGKEYTREYQIDGRWLRVRGKSLADGGRLTVSSDITEEKNREEELRQAQKMEAVGQLTGGIAHDFNNMLATILGNLELAEPLLADRPDAMKRVRKAIGAVQKGATLVSRLLAFSRKQALEPAPTDVNALVGDLSELMHRTLGEQVAISLDFAPDLWPTSIDRNQLENAVLNLAINARDAIAGGGELTISTRNATLDGAAPRNGEKTPAGDFVALAVRDNGCGMTPDILDNAFEPFFTTKEVGVGSGLGLSMVYGFVKQSGGHVHIDSAPGDGTKVSLYLPRYSES